MSDLIPATDAELDALQTLALETINGAPTAYGLSPVDPLLAAANAAAADWNTRYPASITAKAAAQAAVAAKEISRHAGLEPALRNLFAKILANPNVSNEKREAAGLPVYDIEPTPVPVPTTRPVLIADTSERFRLTMHFADEGTPTKKAKPFGVIGCELRYVIGATPPVDPEDYELAGLITRTPHLEEFDPEVAGQMAHWVGRWRNTRGLHGPWSDVVSATVPG